MIKILVIGGSPRDLGGYSDHNPLRAYCKDEFRRLVRALNRPPGEVEVYSSLALGPPTWVAELLREESLGRLIRCTLASTEERFEESRKNWTEKQRSLYATLLASATRHEELSQVEHLESFHLIFVFGGVHWRWNSALLAAHTAGARIHRVDPETAPIKYQAAMSVEEVRALLPGGLEAATERAYEINMKAFKDPSVGPRMKEKFANRVADLSDLKSVLRRLRERA